MQLQLPSLNLVLLIPAVQNRLQQCHMKTRKRLYLMVAKFV